jgi:hypothetical protein
MTTTTRVAAAAGILSAAFGFVGMGLGTVAQAQSQYPDYHWCPHEAFDPAWGPNWNPLRCHDNHYYDGEPRDKDHYHH